MMEFLIRDQKRLEEIYKSYNTNEEEIKRDVEILKEWIKKQPHLPQKLPYDGFLEQMLKSNKYRIERTKERIESYFTLKTLNLELFQGLASDSSAFTTNPFIGIGIFPICTEKNEDIIFVYMKSSDPDLFDFNKYLQLLVSFCEIYLRYNNGASIQIISEVKNFSLGQFKKIDFVKYGKLIKLFLDGYGFRISGINFLNLPIYCYPVLTLFKSLSSAKMVARFNAIDSLESLQKYVPKHILPEELGGTATYTMEELSALGDVVLQNQQSFIADSVNYVTNEKLRIGKSKYDDMFGVDGTFKQMNLD